MVITMTKATGIPISTCGMMTTRKW